MRSATRPISARSTAWSTGGDIGAAWRERRARVNRFCRYNPAHDQPPRLGGRVADGDARFVARQGVQRRRGAHAGHRHRRRMRDPRAGAGRAVAAAAGARPGPLDRGLERGSFVGVRPRTVRRRGHRDRGRDQPAVRGGGRRDDQRRRAMGRRRRAHVGMGERRAGHRTLLRGAGRGRPCSGARSPRRTTSRVPNRSS